MPTHDYLQFFPFSKIRKEQKKAIEFAIDAYESGKKYVVLELGTGVGKSATGITIARYMESYGAPVKNDAGDSLTGAYIVTTQKILQEQYLRDFGPQCGKGLVRSIKASSNYTCSFYTDQSCAESKRILLKLGKQLNGTEFQKHCKQQCKYSIEKQEFIDSPLAITNFSYILAESNYSGKLEPRSMLVIDEAHNIESELGKFVEVTFSEKFAKDIIKCKPPKSDAQASVFDWIKNVYRKAVKKYAADIEKSLVKISNDIEGYGAYSKQYEMLEKHIGKIEQFLEVYNPKNWIMNISSSITDSKKSGKKYEFKPVDVSPYSQPVLFRLGGRTLMMSATIVDKNVFCQSLGLVPEEVAYLSIPSPFPVENRPIHILSVGSMAMASIDTTLPKVAEVVKMLLEKHSNEKGIIHAANYKVAKYIQENVNSKRIMLHDSTDREKVLKHHIESAEPTVLISPSMMEGVDLADEASRFQILCKVPFPYLGDLVSVKRKEARKDWYDMQTVKLILQSVGRSVRNEKDYATSYILDTSFQHLYRRSKWMFPEDFCLSVKF